MLKWLQSARFRHVKLAMIPGFVALSSSPAAQWYVPVGGSSALGIARANACENGEFVPADVPMLFSVYDGALPSFFEGMTYNPNPSDKGWASGLIETYAAITATDSATPGDFGTWYDASSAVGGCPLGSFGGGTYENGATVVAGITGPTTNPDYVWWLNLPSGSLYPDDFPNTAVLTLPSMTPAFGPFTWTITTGTSELEFSKSNSPTCASRSSCTTSNPSVMIDGTAPSPVMTPRDITITVTTAAASGSPFDYGIKYKPFKMTVREPYQWTRINPLPQCSPYSNPNHPTVVGWTCDICYTTLDQNGNELPNKIIPFNENFTSAAMPVYPGETWTQPSQCGPCSSGHAQNLCDDLVKASNHPQTYVPPIVAFGSGDGSAEVDYWSGDWRVGSSTEPEGVGVQENIWVRYQDHGDHAQATSPPSRLLPP